MTKTLRVFISGRVQGVGYRAWVLREAGARGLRGWVRNCRDGRVEALLTGPEDAVDAMLAACQKGPPLARVTGITTGEAEDDGAENFTQKPTP